MAAMVSSTKPDFVERVGVDGDLHVEAVGDGQAAIDGGRRRAPVLVQLQAAGAGADLLLQRPGQAAVALAQKAEVDRQRLGGLQHAFHVPRAGRAGGGVGAGGRAGAAAEQRGQAGGDGGLDQLRADEVDVVSMPPAVTIRFSPAMTSVPGPMTRLRIDAGLDQRIARLADGDDPAVADADVALDDAPVVEDDGVGDDQIELAVRPSGRAAAIGPGCRG